MKPLISAASASQKHTALYLHANSLRDFGIYTVEIICDKDEICTTEACNRRKRVGNLASCTYILYMAQEQQVG